MCYDVVRWCVLGRGQSRPSARERSRNRRNQRTGRGLGYVLEYDLASQLHTIRLSFQYGEELPDITSQKGICG